jgi:hypothetical protein
LEKVHAAPDGMVFLSSTYKLSSPRLFISEKKISLKTNLIVAVIPSVEYKPFELIQKSTFG